MSCYFPGKGSRKLTCTSEFVVNARGASPLLPLACSPTTNDTVLCIHEVLCICKESKESKFLSSGARLCPFQGSRLLRMQKSKCSLPFLPWFPAATHSIWAPPKVKNDNPFSSHPGRGGIKSINMKACESWRAWSSPALPMQWKDL